MTSDLFRLAVEASPAAIFMVDGHGQIELVNAEGERMFGFERGGLIGASIDLLVPSHVRESHHGYRDAFSNHPLKRQMGAGRDLRAVRGDGSEFPVEIGLTPVLHADRYGVLAVVVDITARREAEKAIQDKMAELERANASLAHFAFVASHDIQEPLRKIVAFSEILAEAIADNNREDLQLASGVMRTAALQARVLVAGMLSLARSMNNAYEFATISIADVVDAALHNLSHAIEACGARVVVRVDPLTVNGDRQQAIQLVQNIVENALKYRKANQTPRIEIQTTPLGTAPARLSVRDQGVGFPASRREEIFEPFKRLHGRDEYPGSGLGLAICKSIATRHGWTLAATSAPGAGACFEVIFSGA